jgi:hypothetical protein
VRPQFLLSRDFAEALIPDGDVGSTHAGSKISHVKRMNELKTIQDHSFKIRDNRNILDTP